MTKKVKVDRIMVYITGFQKTHKRRPTQTEIATGVGVTRQAIHKYFSKNSATLKNFPEYGHYFS